MILHFFNHIIPYKFLQTYFQTFVFFDNVREDIVSKNLQS